MEFWSVTAAHVKAVSCTLVSICRIGIGIIVGWHTGKAMTLWLLLICAHLCDLKSVLMQTFRSQPVSATSCL